MAMALCCAYPYGVQVFFGLVEVDVVGRKRELDPSELLCCRSRFDPSSPPFLEYVSPPNLELINEQLAARHIEEA